MREVKESNSSGCICRALVGSSTQNLLCSASPIISVLPSMYEESLGGGIWCDPTSVVSKTVFQFWDLLLSLPLC